MEQTTNFGFQEVPIEKKAKLVDEVFSSVATKYDLMNDLMSLGIHRVWKKIAIQHCNARPGQRILDLAGGTGDLSFALGPEVGKEGCVILADINAAMLQAGRSKLIDKGLLKPIEYAQVDAEALPFADNSFDCVIIGFGLRNVTRKDIALAQMFRVLKPGGRVVILEFSKPLEVLKPLYDLYSFKMLPFLGKIIANDAASYKYLAESIRMHPDQTTLQNMLESVGFTRCSYINLTAGICAIHKGFKI
jgi:demethylmenaquinone methyltransferase / 2-methoxy-6-polyprenyl-1,4-benzoquinol methylase